ncbi:hypothetical protein BYT27DRAFT_7193049 [Phlegmacium glaucopus]|nr:hypothetical protein BYT27DRAFT_7193049 [Phlegmacium glaucopus]
MRGFVDDHTDPRSKHTVRNKTSQPISGRVHEKLHKNRAFLTSGGRSSTDTMASEVHRRLVKLNKIRHQRRKRSS